MNTIARPAHELADIVRQYGDAFIDHYHPLKQHRVYSTPFENVERRLWVVIWTDAMPAVMSATPTTPVATGTAPNVRVPIESAGYSNGRRISCQYPTSTLSSRCLSS